MTEHPAGRRVVVLVAGVVLAVALGLVVGTFVVDDRDPEPTTATTLPATAADVGFLQDMADHHGQAVQMASFVAVHGSDPQVRSLAQSILATQATERGQILAYLRDRGEGLADPDQPAMAWAGEPVERSAMPGLVAATDLADLLALEGAELDARFLALMTSHHEGGVQMADHGRTHASDPAVLDLAAAMAVTQQEELADIAAMRG